MIDWQPIPAKKPSATPGPSNLGSEGLTIRVMFDRPPEKSWIGYFKDPEIGALGGLVYGFDVDDSGMEFPVPAEYEEEYVQTVLDGIERANQAFQERDLRTMEFAEGERTKTAEVVADAQHRIDQMRDWSA